MISSFFAEAMRTFAPAIINSTLIVLREAMPIPSSVMTTEPDAKKIFPCRLKTLLRKVNKRKMLMGIQPDLNVLKGTFIKRIHKTARKIK